MNQKVLVTYATRCGSTAAIAQAIAGELTSRGYSVDVRPVKEVSNLSGYQAVVLGSAIRFGQWLPEASTFVSSHQAALKNLPTAFFTVHIMNAGEDETSRKARLAYLDPVRALVTPQAEAFFTGMIELDKLTLFDRIIAKLVKSETGDQRDLPAIRAWGQTVLA